MIHGTAGAGDFFATALSPDSFNHQTGRQIALMGKCEAPSEGCRAVGNLLKVLNGRGTDLPILYALDHIINQDADPKTVFENLLGVRA